VSTENPKQPAGRISDIIDLKKLEHESRRYLWLGYVIAIMIHSLTGVYFMYVRNGGVERSYPERTERPAIPIELRIVSPRSGMPYAIRRREFTERTPERRIPGTAAPSKLPESKPTFEYEGMALSESPVYDFDAILESVPDSIRYSFEFVRPEDLKIRRYEDNHVLFSDENVPLEYLDNGEYMGIVLIDPEDRFNTRGIIHIPSVVYGQNLDPGGTSVALEGLANLLVSHTGIRLIIDGPVNISSPDLFKYPFIYITANNQFDLAPFEAENLKNYLEKGGFALVEPLYWDKMSRNRTNLIETTKDVYGVSLEGPGEPVSSSNDLGMQFALDSAAPEIILSQPNPTTGPVHKHTKLSATMKNMIVSVLPDAPLEPIPDEHPIFYCYYEVNYNKKFDFTMNVPDPNRKTKYSELLGVFLDGNLGIVYAQDLGRMWTGDNDGPDDRLGINLALYALFRGGSTVRRLVDVSTVKSQLSRSGWEYGLRQKNKDTEKMDFKTRRRLEGHYYSNPGYNRR